MGKTSIEWTDFSVNPIRARLGDRVGHYCEKVSPGCKHCYSSRLQPRFGLPVFQDQRNAGVEPFLDQSKLQEVLRRRKPTRWFWCDMTDMFGEWVPFEWVAACFGVMAATPHHTHQVLTKRPERMLAWFDWISKSLVSLGGPEVNAGRGVKWYASNWLDEIRVYDPHHPWVWPLPNVWLGTSVENQKRADERIPLLLRCPAVVRFLSVEPLLGWVDLLSALGGPCPDCGHPIEEHSATSRIVGCTHEYEAICGCRTVARDLLHWVIVGGESGHGARQCGVEWLRSVVRQCRDAGVPVFVKQLGANYVDAPNGIGGHRARAPADLGIKIRNLHDRKGGDPEEWPADLRVRQFPEVRHG